MQSERTGLSDHAIQNLFELAEENPTVIIEALITLSEGAKGLVAQNVAMNAELARLRAAMERVEGLGQLARRRGLPWVARHIDLIRAEVS